MLYIVEHISVARKPRLAQTLAGKLDDIEWETERDTAGETETNRDKRRDRGIRQCKNKTKKEEDEN